jgi:putative transposase
LLTYRYRVKSLNGLLNQQSRVVNFVWNYCNDRQKDALRFNRKWHSGFDLNKLTTGSSKELGLYSGTVNAVCEQYAKSRSQKRRPYLRYRAKKSLGWVPMKGRDLKREGNAFRFAGNTFRVFSSRALREGTIKGGTCFSRDTRGNWFLNVVIKVAVVDAPIRQPVRGLGIDLGLQSFATLSTGEAIDAQRIYRSCEKALAVAQRANKARQVKHIHAKIANRRADFAHKLSTRLVHEFDYIAVGNVNAAQLSQTKMAKSVLDAGWSQFRHQLAYKAMKHGAWFEEVDESFTTQICSSCGTKPDSRPKGIADLGIRRWTCSGCGCEHDRDVNAAVNILKKFSAPVGHDTLAVGILAL